ncbi:MAG: TIGR03790 family protein [Nitrospirota bacterium]|nr:TIGR03790 family protein [Nitrospirota bacterium]
MRWSYMFVGMVLLGCLLPCPVMAVVAPEQVVVLANAHSPESLDLVTYYMERRGIPLGNRVDLYLPLTDTISREIYEQAVIKPVREALVQKSLSKTTKVLVTIFGVPLRVQAPQLTAEEEEWIDDAKQWKQSAIGLLREQEQQVRSQKSSLPGAVQPSVESILPSADASLSAEPSTIFQWKKQLVAFLNALHQDIEEKAHIDQKEKLFGIREKVIRRIFGKVGVKAEVKGISGVSAEQQREEVAVQQILARLMHQPSAATRTHAYELVQAAYGLWGVLNMAQWEIERYQQTDASASLDSELSFLWWEAGSYPLAGRLPNPLYLGYAGKVGEWPLPLLMVSRIDAPTVTHAQRMIDQAIEAESRGLSGKVYVDARGMKKGSPFSYGYYDADLQDFATQFRSGTGYPVTLENTEKRLSQPGQAPDVALYVGWYRLRQYEDAFTFRPGAIGYHIASGEAVSIHNSQEQGWCKNALERGITVTLGPVGEPYLDAFPLPTEFFGLLYSGKYSLVEAYYLSVRYLSWKMVLFGDPLYRPWFKPNAEQQTTAQALLQKRPFPPSPTQVVFPAHHTARDRSEFPGKYTSFDSRVLSP